MVCLIKSKYKEELDLYTELLGSEKRAYAVLCCNNGYTLDKTKDGKPSKLYNDLLEYYKGDVRKATQKKAQLFTSDFTDTYGEWYLDGYKMSDEYKDVFDENGEPSLHDTYFGTSDNKVFLDLQFDNIEDEYKLILNNAKRDEHGNLLAPNGRPTNLTERQYAQVRSKAFKEWFGDWENDPKNASKVVDENGEPLVVYHGSNDYGFDIFDPSKADDKISLFASSSKWIASTYTNFKPLENKLVRDTLLKGNAISLIKNKDWKSLEKLINSIIDSSLPRPTKYGLPLPYGNKDALNKILSIKKELDNPKLSEEEVPSLLAELTKAEDEYYYSGNYTFKVRQSTTIRGKNLIEISIDDSYSKEYDSSYYTEGGVLFRGSPKELIDTLTFDTKVYDLFLNIKNPLILDNQFNDFGHANNWNNLDFSPAAKEVQNKDLWGNKIAGTHKVTKTRDVAAYAKEHGYDGVIFKQISDHGGFPGYDSLNPTTDAMLLYDDMHIGEDSWDSTSRNKSDIFIAYNSNQIKSATDNVGTFSTLNDNIKYNKNTDQKDSAIKVLENLGFVHKRYGLYFITKGKFKTNYNTTYSYNDIVRIVRQSLVKNGILPNIVDFKLSKTGNSIYVKINENVTDAIAQNLEQINLKEVLDIFEKMQSIIPSLREVKIISNKETLELTGGVQANAFVKNGIVYINKAGFNSKDTVIEECLHSFVNDLSTENRSLFNSLLRRAKRDFPQLTASIVENYSDKEGFTQDDRNQELVTLVLSRYMRKELEKPSKGLLRAILNFLTWLKTKLENIFFNPVTNKHEIDASFFINGMTFENIAEILNSGDVLLNTYSDESVRYNKNARKRLQEAKKKIKSILDQKVPTFGTRDFVLTSTDDLIDELTQTIQSKNKSYKSKSNIDSALLGDELLIARNQETERQVLQAKQTIVDRFKANHTANLLTEKANVILKFLESATSDINNVMSVLENAKANNYDVVYFNKDLQGNRVYTDTNGNITSNTATSNTFMKQFTFDDLSYLTTDITGFYQKVLDDINTFVVYNEYSNNPVVQEILSLIHDLDVFNKLKRILILKREALEKLVDFWLNEKINSIASSEMTDEMKQRLNVNCKKWLRAQYDFGDLSSLTRFCGLMSNSQSPICRMIVEQIYQMNQEVDAIVKEKGDRLELLLRDAEHEASFLGKYKPGNVMTKLMEVDRNGKYTGDFVQPINSRQFYSDLNDCKAALIYGKNGLEEQVRKLSGNNDYEILLDDQGDPIIPTDPKFDNVYKNYLKSVEHFMCEHANRMFTEKYYIDRINTMSVTTLRAMKSLNSQIMSLKQSVTINGKFRPDLLTKKLRNELLQLLHDRIMMSNPFDETGELKDPDSVEGIIAKDLMTWSELTKNKIKYVTDEDAFNEALSNLNTKQEKDLFKEQFTRVAINPKLYETVDKTSYVGNNPDVLNVINQLDELRKQRNKLLGINKKGEEFTSYDWSSVFDLKTGNIKNEQLWINLKLLDNKINALNFEYRSYMRLYKDDFAFPESEFKFSNKFFNGFYSELCVNPGSNFKFPVCFNPNDSVASVFLRMYSQWLVDHNLPASNADIFVDDNGEPLSIFKITVPKAQTFEYEDESGAKTKEPSYIVKPSNLFSKVDVENSNSEYVNTDFDTSDKSVVQPKQEYYKSERYEEMVKHPKLKALYDLLTFEMGEAYKKLPNFNLYDFRLPQIGANTAAILTRNLNSKYGLQFFANAATVWDRYVNANESDVDDYIPERKFRPDGSEIRSIPIRYVERMQDPEHISSDLVGSVVKFIEMAENYTKRSKNVAFLETLTENVKHYDRSESNHYKTMRDFIDRTVYEKKTGSVGKNLFADKWDHMDWFRKYFLGGGKTLLKRMGILRASSQIISLAFRGISSAVAWFDPYFSAWVEASLSREYGMRDLIAAHCNIAKESLLALASIGTNKSYSKTMAINDAMGISKRAAEQYQGSYKSQLRRVLTGDYRMSFFEVGDYNIRSLIADAMTRNYRLYVDPLTGEKMFLNRNDYIEHCRQNGMTTKQAFRLYNNAKKARSCMKVKNGRLQLDQNISQSEFSKISKATKNMSQKITLMVNQEDRTWLQTNPWTAFVTMLRTFMLCGLSERFKTYHDFQVATDEYDDPVTGEHKEIISDRSMSREDLKNAKKKHYYRGGYSFMSGYVENGTYTSGFKGIYRMFTNFKTFKYWFNNYVFHLANMSQEELKKQDISAAEIYNADKIIKEMAIVLGCVVASYLVNKKCKDADPDDDDNYWLFFLNAVLMRIGIERITLYNPQTISDIITCITTLTSSVEKLDDAIDLFTDAVGLGEHDPDELIKQGQFKNKTRLFRSLINMFALFGSAGWYATMPKSLGGGGARALYENAEYYRKNIAPWKRLYTTSNTKANKKSNRSSADDPFAIPGLESVSSDDPFAIPGQE